MKMSVGSNSLEIQVGLKLISLFCTIFIGINCMYSYVGTEKSLRQNIEDLYKGELKFNNSLPSYDDELSDITPKNNSEYDFIVIGAGSAGSVIASRLSEMKKFNVLLIEAGSKEYPIMDIPFLAAGLQLSDEINWNYQTETSDKYCLGFTNRRCAWPRGKVMGGSSVLNFMLATRGNKNDFNEWANITDDKSWEYKNMLKYFKKLENYQVNDVPSDPSIHNNKGPLYITSQPYHSELGKAFIKANEELGIWVNDYNGHQQMGVSYFQSTIINGERWSTNRAYLYPAKNRKNLYVTKRSHVNKILINEKTKEAYGVQFFKSNKIIEVKAKKEIILCAGAINSPQILMLSGIRPTQHLLDLGIPVIKDAPVGENLMDHIGFGGMIFKVNDSATYKDSNILDPKNPDIKDYINHRNGTLALGVGYEALTYFDFNNSKSSNNGIYQPDIELLFAPGSGMKSTLFSEIFNIAEEYRNKLYADKFNHSSWFVLPMITNPKSRGKLLLGSKNPNDKPKLYANYLNDPYDVKILIEGIRLILKLSKTKTFQKYGSELYRVPLPSFCYNYQFDTDEYWECALRTYTLTIYHQSGTCKMGRENDRESVVNSKLQVIGIKNLRVADASIMPKIVSAHPNIPIIAFAEKISDELKRKWNKY